MTRFFAVFLLLLAGCDRPVTRAEAEDIADDHAVDTSGLESRVADLEQEVASLKTEQAASAKFLGSTSDYSLQANQTQDAEIKRLTANERVWIDHINILRNNNGWPPVIEKK